RRQGESDLSRQRPRHTLLLRGANRSDGLRLRRDRWLSQRDVSQGIHAGEGVEEVSVMGCGEWEKDKLHLRNNHYATPEPQPNLHQSSQLPQAPTPTPHPPLPTPYGINPRSLRQSVFTLPSSPTTRVSSMRTPISRSGK